MDKVNIKIHHFFLMNNYLIFRTDRIGDFLISSILIKSIKLNDKKAHISVVCSSKIFLCKGL